MKQTFFHASAALATLLANWGRTAFPTSISYKEKRTQTWTKRFSVRNLNLYDISIIIFQGKQFRQKVGIDHPSKKKVGIDQVALYSSLANLKGWISSSINQFLHDNSPKEQFYLHLGEFNMGMLVFSSNITYLEPS